MQQMFNLIQTLHATEDHVFLDLLCAGGDALVAIETASAESVLRETMDLYRIPAAASSELLAHQATAAVEANEVGEGAPAPK